jgi:hypothetical protein
LKSLGRYTEAVTLLRQVTKTKKVGSDTYIIPFAYYELGGLYMGANLPDELDWSQVTLADVNGEVKDSPRLQLGVTEQAFYVDFKQAKECFHQSKNYKKDFNFKIRLLFRLHLATMERRRLINSVNGEAVGQSQSALALEWTGDNSSNSASVENVGETMLAAFEEEDGDDDDMD